MKKATDPMADKMSGHSHGNDTEPMAKQMSKAGSPVATDHRIDPPKKGEQFRCEVCGMELKITADCRCEEPGMVHFHCCGQELVKT